MKTKEQKQIKQYRKGGTELKLINIIPVGKWSRLNVLYPFIPYGKVTIIQGRSGRGKTTMCFQIIAKLTKGESILPVDLKKR